MGNADFKTDDADDGFLDELDPGTELLQGQYRIQKFLNAGGFGITYLASNSLDRTVVIKECFPSSVCNRSRAIVQARTQTQANELRAVVKLFVQEARRLAKLDHPNIVGVHEVFEENNTAYMVLDFVEGRDLLDTLEDPDHGLTPSQIKDILKQVLSAVQFIHDQDILHRDISPDNILLDENLRPVLIDFGAAREEATKKSRALSAMRVVKDGYSPQEFYIQGSEQAPSSDLYSLAASFYHLIVGEIPPNSQIRLAAFATGEADPYQSLVGRIAGYDDHFLSAIDTALGILPKDRMQSATEWLSFMKTGQRVLSVNLSYTPSAFKEQSVSAPRKPRGIVRPVVTVAAIACLAVGGLAASGNLPIGDMMVAFSNDAVRTDNVDQSPDIDATNPIRMAAPVIGDDIPAIAAVGPATTAATPHAFTLNNGDAFEAIQVGDTWQTIVTAQSNPASDLKVGDQIVAFLPSNEKLTEQMSLQNILAGKPSDETDQFQFAVSRNGSLLIASMTYDADA